jgi:peroxiredoxin
MSLKEKLDKLKESYKTILTPDAMEIVNRATEDLKNSGIMDHTVKVGDKAPDFKLKNTENQDVNLSTLLAKGPVVLTFYRGKYWGYCNLELEALGEAAAQFKEKGAVMVAVSPQIVAYNKAMKNEKNLSFEILSDPGNQIAEKYGIKFQMPDDLITVYKQLGLKVDEHNGDDTWTLPMPARLIIDQKGVIRYAEINSDYTERPDPEDTLASLREVIDWLA